MSQHWPAALTLAAVVSHATASDAWRWPCLRRDFEDDGALPRFACVCTSDYCDRIEPSEPVRCCRVATPPMTSSASDRVG